MANKTKLHPLTIRILIEIVVLVTVLVLLLVWIGSLWKSMGEQEEEPKERRPKPTQTDPVETPPPETDPPDTSPEGVMDAFMADYGLTVDDYPDYVLESYQIAAYEDQNPNFETQEFLLNYPLLHGVEQTVDISGVDRSQGVPLFLQWDPRWGYVDYGVSICGIGGCGPTSLSMVAYYLTGDPKYTPVYMMEYAIANKHNGSGGGTNWSLFNVGAVELGFTVQELPNVKGKVTKALEEGKPVVINVKEGYFTTGGHYMVIVEYKDGLFRINDPNSPYNSQQWWAWEDFIDDVTVLWAISK